MSHEEAFMTARDFLMNIAIILTMHACPAMWRFDLPSGPNS